MGLSKRGWLLALVILMAASTSAVAQARIHLVQGRRAVKDSVTFIVEVAREKNQNPRYAAAPEDMSISIRFTDRPASGMVYLDGKALGRFDESMSFNSNSFDIAYGRHSITLMTSPTTVIDISVFVRGGVAREVFDSPEEIMVKPSILEQRVLDLERKVHELEAEVATLRKKLAQ